MLKPISELYEKYKEEDIYILGTGTSLRVLDLRLLDKHLVIGLNQAWRQYPVDYNITMRPELNIPQLMDKNILYEGSSPDWVDKIAWIVKRDKLNSEEEKVISQTKSDSYYFEGNKGKKHSMIRSLKDPLDINRRLDWVLKPDPTYLYLWTSIAQSAMNLAANMGARNIFLLGCDNCALGDNHHVHKQHIFWRGEDTSKRYLQYYEGNAEVRHALRERGVNVYSITPFMKLDDPYLDFKRLCREENRQLNIQGKDISQAPSLFEENRQFTRLFCYIVRQNIRAVFKFFGLSKKV